jgi:hypothetical protein
VAIDLIGRVVASRQVSPEPNLRGHVAYHDADGVTEISLPYALSDAWLLVDAGDRKDDWQRRAENRRRQRLLVEPCDTREVLLGELCTFLVEACLKACGESHDPSASIHALWLTTPRATLGGCTPRDVLLKGRLRLDEQVELQAIRWSKIGQPPPAVPRDADAYRFADFGTHQNIIYYDLVRHLVDACWERVSQDQHIEAADEIDRLERLKQDWLHTPTEALEEHSPAQVMALERSQLPLTIPASRAVIDDDCPLCRMMAESPGPIFCHLDDSHMDDEFAFSLCETLEDWQVERGVTPVERRLSTKSLMD